MDGTEKTEGDEHYLLRKRDDAETSRLNLQHDMVLRVQGGHSLDPSIPKSTIHRIADVATGTGVWLKDVSQELHLSGNSNVEFTGFDISSVQFPAEKIPNTEFVVWDINNPFPDRYHKYFDVVHVRFLCVSLKAQQLPKAVENVVALLKPGGYLQWDDYDWQQNPSRVFPPSLPDYAQTILDFFTSQDYPMHLLDLLPKILSSLPIQDIQTKDYVKGDYQRPEFRKDLVAWLRVSSGQILTAVYLRGGKAKNAEEAGLLVDEYKKKLDSADEKGEDFPIPLVSVVAMKKL